MNLPLTLKAKWFEMIESGVKTEEYREIKSYWYDRLILRFDDARGCVFKPFATITFRNGYQRDAPSMKVEVLDIAINQGNQSWGAVEGTDYFVFKLGKIIERSGKQLKTHK